MQTKLALKQQLKVTPQQVLVSMLLQTALVDLDQVIAAELADNPALECVYPPSALDTVPPTKPAVMGMGYGETASALDSWADLVADQPSLMEQLTAQLTLLADGPSRELATALLHYLDDHGYLRFSTAVLAQELAVEPPALEAAIRLLHSLDPPGIGARDLRECLQLQCAQLTADGVDCTLVTRILAEAWEDFCQERWPLVARKLQVSRTAVHDVQRFIRHHLYPYPLALVRNTPSAAPTVRADLVIQRRLAADAFVYVLEVAGMERHRLRVNADFAETLRTAKADERMISSDAYWLRSHIQRAQHFITALQQRWTTLARIGEYVMVYQQPFLSQGALALKPLTQAMVAAALGLHEATVSRAIHDKYVQLPDGRLLPLTAFFDHSLPAKEIIRQVLAAANHTLSDQEVADCLRTRGITLARRTVAKYREQLKIPASYCR